MERKSKWLATLTCCLCSLWVVSVEPSWWKASPELEQAYLVNTE